MSRNETEQVQTTGDSLESRLRTGGSVIEVLRNVPFVSGGFPGLTNEWTNYRDEQTAWRESAALLDQSHHMVDMFLRGPDALRVLSEVGINGFDDFAPGRAKQFVAVTEEGHVVGDAVLFHLEPGVYDLVGLPTVAEWLRFHIETGGYDVEVEWDGNSASRPGPPRLYRYEVQGPLAVSVVEAAAGGPIPDVPFFHTAQLTIAGRAVRALRHGMAGQKGFELFGPWEDGAAVRDALLAAGEPIGLQRVGARAYWTATIESGWIATPIPGYFAGASSRAFREWAGPNSLASFGGSAESDRVEDYLVTPWNLGYERLIDFDHEFIGRDALRRMREARHRRKVTLVWDGAAVAAAFARTFDPAVPAAKAIELPKSRYARFHYDRVRFDGHDVGYSVDPAFLWPERSMLSLAIVDPELAQPGTEVSLIWGEAPGHRRPQSEEHVQIEIPATVVPSPLKTAVRTD